jgi:glycosyltransferase involved in cell wall biosynthesis
VISSSHAGAQGVIVSPDALHVSYVYSPMRYAWDQQFHYLRDKDAGSGLKGALLRWTLHRLRIWDHRSAAGVDRFVADSHFVARRILKAYRRDSTVIYPPVDTGLFTPSGEKEAYYVTVSRLMPYKRVDVLVIGGGPEYASLKAAATANVELAGHLPAQSVVSHLQRARAFLFAAVEDFGIAPIEAMACGTPVIALRRGGGAETVAGPESDEPTGIFFEEQSADAVAAAVEEFENRSPAISAEACRRRALGFSAERFRAEFTAFVERAYADWRSGSRP